LVSISVILPVYNAEEHIAESLQSILNQSFNLFEVIVINDGSTDRTEEIVKSFDDNRIRYYKNEKNIKLIDTLNLGLQLTRGKYIARMDADDIALSNRFENQVEFLENNPDYGLIGSYAQEFGDSTNVVKYVVDDEDIRYAFLTHNPFVHSSVMFRSSLIKKYNLQYDKRWLHVEDYDFWIKLLGYTKGKNLPEIFVNYRVHNSQISFQFRDLQLKNTRLLQQQYLETKIKNDTWSSFIIKLLNGEKSDVSKLVVFLKQFPLELIEENVFTKRLENQFLKIVKNQLLESYNVSFREQCQIITILSFFTLKQKIALLTKIF
jgi:glycosyltransferase involved in cell wall biosynthesis